MMSVGETDGVALESAQRLAAEIQERLREDIIFGRLRPDEPVRLIQTAERFGVSTTPVREAMAALERQGLLSSQPNRGFTVNNFDAHDVEDLFAVHAFIIGRCAAAAVPLMSNADLDEMVELDQQMTRAVEEGRTEEAIELNDEIHRRIRTRGNSIVMGRLLSETAPFVRKLSDRDAETGHYLRTVPHVHILDAMRARDADKVAELMTEHVMAAGIAAVQHFIEHDRVSVDGR
ncbi:GntR family transcriptional regulator [Nocardioides sp.]|uniref:GntR family transcriptional regulator n=1 Tax=Nocardioides sp. TaxID=35761 RepID=UPI003D12BC08